MQYYWQFLEAAPSPLGARNLGTRVHLALEAWFGYGVDPIKVLNIIYGAEVANHPDKAKELNTDLEMSVIMVEGLLEWMAAEGHTESFKVVVTEAEVRVPLPGFEGRVDLRAKLDQVGQFLDTGALTFLDWKTGDSLPTMLQARHNPQMRTYSLIQWLDAGYPPPFPGRGAPDTGNGAPPLVLGGTIATLRKVKRTKQSKPPYYGWVPFFHTPEIMASTLLGIQGVAREILDARAELDAAYERGGHLEQIDLLQRELFRPTWIDRDCDWRCPLSQGACQMMDDGSAWVEHFVRSGEYIQGDAYERYGRGSIAALVAAAG